MVPNKQNPALLLSLSNAISFNSITKFDLKHKRKIRQWIFNTLAMEKKKTGFISFNFCSDTYLLKINQKYLKHDYYTDIITFDLVDGKIISGDIYVSIDRVKDNATSSGNTFQNELNRVMIHGILHLCGYNDKSKGDKILMRKKEDYYLSLLP